MDRLNSKNLVIRGIYLLFIIYENKIILYLVIKCLDL